jgi:myo-inositol-1-phosphate synthase
MKHGVLIVGMNGATANTTIVGALLGTQEELALGSITSGMQGLSRHLSRESSFVFGGWDVSSPSPLELANSYHILPTEVLSRSSPILESLRPMRAVISRHDTMEAKALAEGNAEHLCELERLKSEIAQFCQMNDLQTCTVVYLASPLALAEPAVLNATLTDLKLMLEKNDPRLPSAILYAYAAIESGAAFVDFTPNITLDVPGVQALAEQSGVPIAGRDGSTGQTLMKTVLAEMFQVRNLRLKGWYSANILGNNDGIVLSRPEHRELKMHDKLAVLEQILGYDGFAHAVDITYYPPRGDSKEAWDSVDFTGWFSQPMAMKIDWQGRDSILAAPLVLDLCKHMQFAQSKGSIGIQEHLAIYFKQPIRTGALAFSAAARRLREYYQ